MIVAAILSMDIALSSTSTPKRAKANFGKKELKLIIVETIFGKDHKYRIFELGNYLSEVADLW